MIISVSSLKESRQNALIRLQKIQSLQISDNYLDYQVESYINLKQLIESNVINKFSLGQLSLIVFNIVVHLIKVYQKIKISQLTLENIIFNQELKVKFINLHEEENIQTYQQNLQIIIVLIKQIFLKYQEVIIEQYKKDQKQITICKKIELATFYSNKILTLLQSQRHFKKLKLFVQNQIEKGKIIDDLLVDSLTDEREFRNIFQNQLLFNNSQRNSQQIPQQPKPTEQQFSDQSQSFGSSQQEQTTNQFQQQDLSTQTQRQINEYQKSKEIKETTSVQYDQFLKEKQPPQNTQQQPLIPDVLQQDNSESDQIYVSQSSQSSKAINPELLAFYKGNISNINNKDFIDKLLELFSKNYKQVDKEKATYYCQAACYYFSYLDQYKQYLQNQLQINQDSADQFFNNGLYKLIRLCYDDRLLEKSQEEGYYLCQANFQQLYQEMFCQFQQEQVQQNNIY